MPAPSKLEARVPERDRRSAAIRKLILQGMKMIDSLAASQRDGLGAPAQAK